jgi:hypothetical protein
MGAYLPCGDPGCAGCQDGAACDHDPARVPPVAPPVRPRGRAVHVACEWCGGTADTADESGDPACRGCAARVQVAEGYVPWTAWERALLGRLWPRASREEIRAALPRRDWNVIASRAWGFGYVRLAERAVLPNAWSTAERAVLERLVARGVGWEEAARALRGRTPKACRGMAKRLGYARPRRVAA